MRRFVLSTLQRRRTPLGCSSRLVAGTHFIIRPCAASITSRLAFSTSTTSSSSAASSDSSTHQLDWEEQLDRAATAKPVQKVQALQGVRVLDFSRILAAPYATMLLGGYLCAMCCLDLLRVLSVGCVLALTRLCGCMVCAADLGADVVKIENPKGGDDTRTWGMTLLALQHNWLLSCMQHSSPFFCGCLSVGPPFAEPGHQSVYFLSINRNKRSVALDLKTPQGVALAKRLVAKADVVIENFVPGKVRRLLACVLARLVVTCALQMLFTPNRWMRWVWGTTNCRRSILA
jgi:hypothetical protein